MTELKLEMTYLINPNRKGKKTEEVYISPKGTLCIKRQLNSGYLLKNINNVVIDDNYDLIFSMDMEDGDEFIIADKFSSYFDLFGLKEYETNQLKKDSNENIDRKRMFETVEDLKKSVVDGKVYIECELESDLFMENGSEELKEIIFNEYFSNFESELEEGSIDIEVYFIDLMKIDKEREMVTVKVTTYVEFE